MLRHRLLTAIILIPVLLGGCLVLSTPQIATVFAGLVALAAWEWAGLMGLDSALDRTVYAVLMTLILPLASELFAGFPNATLTAVLVSWLLAMTWIANSDGRCHDVTRRELGVLGLVGILVLVPTWLSLIELHGQGPFGRGLLIYLFVLVWTADSGAYFAGRRWGRTRLAPALSPGKTWEGAYGALAAAIVLALIAAFWLGLGWARGAGFVLLSIITVLFSIVGDLFESSLKRRRGLKDSGHLLPGHGGILDRIDSLTAAAPIFCLGLMLQGFIL